jgi:hypothetical protein
MSAPRHYRDHDTGIEVLTMSIEERRALYYLLDRLCEHEECAIECATYPDGTFPRSEPEIAVRSILQCRRVWRTAQWLMELVAPNPGEKIVDYDVPEVIP